MQSVAEYLRAATDADVWLDVGCGSGWLLQAVWNGFDRRIGLDISTGMLGLARDRYQAVACADILSLPLPDESVSVVSAFSVLHHLLRPEDLIAEAARVLKPGGYLYTDWDTNSRSLYHPLVLKLVWLWRRYVEQRDLLRFRHPAVHALAEVHHDLRGGLDASRLGYSVVYAGFDICTVFFYDGCPPNLFTFSHGDLRRKQRTKFLLTGKWSAPLPSELCHRFSMLARRAA